jgi:hypothetical protein
MKTIQNKTNAPLRVPLPRGKKLHLGPGKSGQIAHQDADHEPLQRLIKEGKLEILGDGSAVETTRERGRSPHASTHGHQPTTTRQVKGDR